MPRKPHHKKTAKESYDPTIMLLQASAAIQRATQITVTEGGFITGVIIMAAVQLCRSSIQNF
jgi:hypothetical protein